MDDKPIQLDLFESVEINYNRGLELLFSLKAVEAEAAFSEFEADRPGWRDLSLEFSVCELMAEFPAFASPIVGSTLKKGAAVWEALKKELIEPHPGSILVSPLKSAVIKWFVAAVDMLGSVEVARNVDPATVGEWYLVAGRLRDALRWYEKALADLSAPRSRVLAGLGNVHYRRGEHRKALEYYRDAFAAGAGDVDLDGLACDAVKEFAMGIVRQGEFDDPAVCWVASAGLLRGIFPFPDFRGREELARYKRQYDALYADHTTLSASPSARARLFYTALVLAEQARQAVAASLNDDVDCRKRMKELEPDLFDEFMARLKFK